ncbi:type II secretion system protein [Patescibacteria group bacterium]
MYKKLRGFTFIELLVVIAIIAILVVLVILALNAARARARDSQRKSNLNTLKTTVESYNDDHNYYPKVCAYHSGDYSDSPACNFSPVPDPNDPNPPPPNQLYSVWAKGDLDLEKWPEDPRNTDEFHYDNPAELVTETWYYGYGYNIDYDDSAYTKRLGNSYVLACSLEAGNDASKKWGYKIGPGKDTLNPQF